MADEKCLYFHTGGQDEFLCSAKEQGLYGDSSDTYDCVSCNHEKCIVYNTVRGLRDSGRSKLLKEIAQNG